MSDLVLETARLTLRRLTPSDEDHLWSLDSDPAVMRFLNGGRPLSQGDVRAELARLLDEDRNGDGSGRWAAEDRETGEFLGWFSLRPLPDREPGTVELGYRLRQAAWGRGYATEGARALVHRAFTNLGAGRVVAFTMTVNVASRRVMERAGLRLVRTFFQDWPDVIEGSEQGDVEYALSREEWEGRGP